MSHLISIEQGVAITGAVPMWTRIVRDALVFSAPLLPPGSRVIEVGYGDGLLTCYLAKHLGWRITGFDILESAYTLARANAHKFGISSGVDLRLVKPEETWQHKGEYDGCFIKTVLYNARSINEYGSWLDWVRSVLKPDGIFVNFENGKANLLTYLYRKLRGRYYADLCMYDSQIQRLYEERFSVVYKAHYGAISQFFAPVTPVYRMIAAIEEAFFSRNADNSYITALVAKMKKRSTAGSNA